MTTRHKEPNMIRYINAINALPRPALQGWSHVEPSRNTGAFKNLLVESVRQLNAARAQANLPTQPSATGRVLTKNA
jgi:hypothetical protein